MRGLDDGPAFCPIQCQGLFTVDVLAGLDPPQVNFRMGFGYGEIEHNVNIVLRHQVIYGIYRTANLLRQPGGSFRIDVRDRGNPYIVIGSQPLDIGAADGTTPD